MVAHVYTPITWEVKAGRWETQGHPQLHSKFWIRQAMLYKTFYKSTEEEVKDEQKEEGEEGEETTCTILSVLH